MPPPPLPPPPPPPVLTAVFSVLPAENFGTVAAGIVTFSVGFRGLTPWRSLRCCVENFPKPVKLTSPPLRSVSVIESSTASTASAASRLDKLAFWATLSTHSCFVTVAPLLPVAWWGSRRKTLAGLGFRLNHAVLRRFWTVLPTPSVGRGRAGGRRPVRALFHCFVGRRHLRPSRPRRYPH